MRLFQIALDLSLSRNIPKYQNGPSYFPDGVADRRSAVIDLNGPTSPGEKYRVIRQADDHAFEEGPTYRIVYIYSAVFPTQDKHFLYRLTNGIVRVPSACRPQRIPGS